MTFQSRRWFAVLALGAALLCVTAARADPPARVARLGYTSGAVSLAPGGESTWVQASVNRPLSMGDRLWTDADGRAEIQAAGAMVRMAADTSVTVLNIDDRVAQLQLTQGTLNVNVRYLGLHQVVEIDTPQLAFTLRKSGNYRITVDPDGTFTDILVRKGQGEAYGVGAAYTIDARQPYRFRGTGLRDYETFAKPAPDAFDRWVAERDRRFDRSASARYVSRDVVGYQDLDDKGVWRVDPSYGNVWVPSRVPAGWSPYRDGHWAWIDPWGWTWVDDAPWGYAVSHYGRWANMRGTWGWVPGPARAPALYAPALVAFVGGDNFRVTGTSGQVGGVAWFPLAPREVYQPPYQASRDYVERVNRGHVVVNNTVVNNTVINNTVVNNNVSNVNTVVYANRIVPGAVVAVPAATFVQSQPVARAAVVVSAEQMGVRPATGSALVAPTVRSGHGAAGPGGTPPARVLERAVVARNTPAPVAASLADQLAQLALQPGRPLDDAARKALKPSTTTPLAVVKLATPASGMVSTVAPPPAIRPVPVGPAAPQALASAPVALASVPAPATPASAPGRREDVKPLPIPAPVAPVKPSAGPVSSPAVPKPVPGVSAPVALPVPVPAVTKPAQQSLPATSKPAPALVPVAPKSAPVAVAVATKPPASSAAAPKPLPAAQGSPPPVSRPPEPSSEPRDAPVPAAKPTGANPPRVIAPVPPVAPVPAPPPPVAVPEPKTVPAPVVVPKTVPAPVVVPKALPAPVPPAPAAVQPAPVAAPKPPPPVRPASAASAAVGSGPQARPNRGRSPASKDEEERQSEEDKRKGKGQG